MSANRVPLYNVLYMAEDWVIVRSYSDLVRTVITKLQQEEWPIFVSFGHDLSNEHTQYFFDNGGWAFAPEPNYDSFKENTGLHAAIWLCNFVTEHALPLPGYATHSANPAGARNIQRYLDNFNANYSL